MKLKFREMCKVFSFLSDLFVGLRTPLPRLLSCVKKVGKDHKEPSGSLTSGRERALPPLDFPSGESSLSRFSGAMMVKDVFQKNENIALVVRKVFT